MSACDHLLCRRVMMVTRQRRLAAASKTRIRTLLQNMGTGFQWKRGDLRGGVN